VRVAIASGKGGTGKTTVATGLAVTAARSGRRVRLLDCDVEEPNCHLFLSPCWRESHPFTVPVPLIEEDACTGCGECADFCEFNALACLPDGVLVFPELCHSCGGCAVLCPEHCIAEDQRVVGEIATGEVDGLMLTQGRLNIGEARVPPLIRAVKEMAGDEGIVFLDSPPGTSCPVVETLLGSDHVLLVTEPTPFGLHDLQLAVEMVECLGLNCSVVVNRAGSGDQRVQEFCASVGLPVVAELADDRRVAEAYARGRLPLDAVPELARAFEKLWQQLLAADLAGDGVGRGTEVHP
jgi:MinD superfamily P-loop ATPase